MEAINTESRKRNVAHKIRINDIVNGSKSYADDKFIFMSIGSENIVRVNIVASCIDKFVSEGDRKYANLTVDDATGQIRLKLFGDDVEKVNDILQGDTLQIIGNIREWNKEVYIIPEIIKKVDPRWLLVRKLEIQEGLSKIPTTSINNLRSQILSKIKDADKNGGIEIETLINTMNANENSVNEEIKKLIEEGIIYEPNPNTLRYLG